MARLGLHVSVVRSYRAYAIEAATDPPALLSRARLEGALKTKMSQGIPGAPNNGLRQSVSIPALLFDSSAAREDEKSLLTSDTRSDNILRLCDSLLGGFPSHGPPSNFDSTNSRAARSPY